MELSERLFDSSCSGAEGEERSDSLKPLAVLPKLHLYSRSRRQA